MCIYLYHLSIYLSIYLYIYIYTCIWFRFAVWQPPPMVWVPRARPLDPDFRAFCNISELQLPICPNHFNLRAICTTSEPHLLYIQSIWIIYITRDNIYIYIYIYICFIHLYMMQVRPHVRGICMVLLHPDAVSNWKIKAPHLFRSIQMFYTQGKGWPKQHPYPQGGGGRRWAPHGICPRS